VNIPKGHALIIDAAGNVAVVRRDEIEDEPITSITVPEHQLDEAVARVLALLRKDEDIVE
jgi:hypothetical protein